MVVPEPPSSSSRSGQGAFVRSISAEGERALQRQVLWDPCQGKGKEQDQPSGVIPAIPFPLPLLSQSCHQCLEVMQQGERSPNKGLKGLLTNCISNQLVSLAAPQPPPQRLRGHALFSSSRKGKEASAKTVVAREQH